MIQANELRIGNLVLRDYGINGIKPAEVWQVNHDSVDFLIAELSKGKFHSQSANVSRLSPIPLTEGWLVMLGFDKLPHLTITNSLIKSIGRNRYISIGDVGTPNLMVYLCEKEKEDSRKITDLICLHNWDYDGELYVHQLQNLYFALTGQELTIK